MVAEPPSSTETGFTGGAVSNAETSFSLVDTETGFTGGAVSSAETSFSLVDAVSLNDTSPGFSSFASISRVFSFRRLISRTSCDGDVTPGMGPLTV